MGAAFRQLRQPREFRIAPAAWPQEALTTLEKLASVRAGPPEPADAGEETTATTPVAADQGTPEAAETLPDRTVAELATDIWRLHNRLGRDEDTPRIVMRHLEGALDVLTDAGVEIRDHLGEPYDPGLTLEVLALQPTAGLSREEVIETLRPSVYFRDRAIQRAEVIVGVPKDPGSPGEADEPGLPQPTGEPRP